MPSAKSVLNPSQNYTAYVDIGRGPVSWNLIVCPTDRLAPLECWYPIVGSVPYRGYFDRATAESVRDEYLAEGLRHVLAPRGARIARWGGFPIRWSVRCCAIPKGDLADLIIHELTHATVWVKGDVAFNEGLASFVGEAGALMWLQRGADAQAVQQMLDERADRVVFRNFMQAIAARLTALYRSNAPDKSTLRQRIFDDARTEFHALPLKTDLYARFPSWELNNARMGPVPRLSGTHRRIRPRSSRLPKRFESNRQNFARMCSGRGSDRVVGGVATSPQPLTPSCQLSVPAAPLKRQQPQDTSKT